MSSPRYPAGTGSVAAIAGHPLHPMIVPLPIGALVLALAADVALMVTANAFWAQAAVWLLLVTLVTGVAAAIVGFIDLMSIRRARSMGIGLAHGVGNLLVLFITGANYLLRVGGTENVASDYGILLSGAAVLLTVVTGWLGGELVFRHGIGVTRRVGGPAPAEHEYLPGGEPDLGKR